MDSDVQGTWLYCKYVGKQMIEQGKGGKVILYHQPDLNGNG